MEQPEIKTYTRDEIINGNADDYNKFYPKALVDMAIRSIMENCSRAVRRCSEMQNELCTAYASEVRAYKYKRCLAMANECVNGELKLKRVKMRDMNNHQFWQFDNDYWQKWNKRWLKIAEKFKPNSTAL